MARRLAELAFAAVRDAPPPEAARPSDAELIERARRNLMAGLPDATLALTEHAGKGSATHIKLLFQLLKLDDGALASRETRPQEKSLEQILMEQWATVP
jgi:uncharacterized heparinase superfamily protein